MNPKLEGKEIVEEKEDGYLIKHSDHLDFIPKKNIKPTSIENDDEHHYEFNANDIVSEDEYGYVVIHENHYHYIYKGENNEISSHHEENYKFNIRDIIREDENGYVVKHGNHYYYIPKISNEIPKEPSDKEEVITNLDEIMKQRLTYLSELIKVNPSELQYGIILNMIMNII